MQKGNAKEGEIVYEGDEMVFYDLHDLYRILPFGEKKVRALIKAGEIPVIKVGRNYITTKKKIEEWIENSIGLELYY